MQFLLVLCFLFSFSLSLTVGIALFSLFFSFALLFFSLYSALKPSMFLFVEKERQKPVVEVSESAGAAPLSFLVLFIIEVYVVILPPFETSCALFLFSMLDFHAALELLFSAFFYS